MRTLWYLPDMWQRAAQIEAWSEVRL
jgi:hypothetical protein